MQDLRLALRSLAKSPGFTAVAVLTLALGLGVNTAVFSIVNATFLRALPYAQPENLVMLTEHHGNDDMSASYPDFQDWSGQQDVFSSLALYHPETAKLKSEEHVELVSALLVSADFFTVLGVHPAQGRNLTAQDDRAGAAPVAWVTHAAWRKYFADNPALVGKSIVLDGEAVTVAGILPADFQFYRRAEFFRPLAPYAAQQFMTMRENHNNAYVVARLQPGRTVTAAQAQMTAIAERLEQDYPKTNAGIRVHVIPLQEKLAGMARPQLLLLLGAVGLVLLIACVNVASMLLARSFAREKEMAIRSALGGSRGRLLRQLLVESATLAVLGGAAGILVGLWGYDFGRRMVPWEMQPLVESAGAFDWRVLVFAAGVTLLTGVGFGLAPAWQLSHINPNDALKNTRRTLRTFLGRMGLIDLLVSAQVALALMLLVSAGLLIRSLDRLLQVPSGLQPDQVLTLRVSPPPMGQFQRDPYSFTRFYENVVNEAGALPGVEVAAVASSLPFTWTDSHMVIYCEGRPLPQPGEFPSISNHTVSAGYFRAFGIPLRRGRTFDGHERQPVLPPGLELTPENLSRVFAGLTVDAVISQRMADKYWPGENPVGRRFRLGYPDMGLPWAQIIGVVGNTTQFGLDQGEVEEFYLSIRQFPNPGGFHLVARTRGDPAAAAASLRAAIQRVSDEPASDVRLMADRLADFTSDRRFNMSLFSFFAGTALLLALVGIYGVLSFAVGQRTREVGIRMALGAQRRDVLRDVLARGLRLALIGVLIGLAGAWAVSGLLRSQLFGVAATDPLTYAAGATLLLLAALAACWAPARRATKANPVEALRAE